jgi:hypothetical protein
MGIPEAADRRSISPFLHLKTNKIFQAEEKNVNEKKKRGKCDRV